MRVLLLGSGSAILAGSICEPPADRRLGAVGASSVGAALPGRPGDLAGLGVDAPDRGVALSNASGTVEIYAFDAAAARADDSPGAGLRQVTDRPQGTLHATITPDGNDIWWFADTDGDEFGVWQRQPWDGSGEARPVAAALEARLSGRPRDRLRRHRLRRPQRRRRQRDLAGADERRARCSSTPTRRTPASAT